MRIFSFFFHVGWKARTIDTERKFVDTACIEAEGRVSDGYIQIPRHGSPTPRCEIVFLATCRSLSPYHIFNSKHSSLRIIYSIANIALSVMRDLPLTLKSGSSYV